MRLLSQTILNYDQIYLHEMVIIKKSLIRAFDLTVPHNFTENMQINELLFLWKHIKEISY